MKYELRYWSTTKRVQKIGREGEYYQDKLDTAGEVKCSNREQLLLLMKDLLEAAMLADYTEFKILRLSSKESVE